MKQITKEQIKQVMDTMMELNIPVKVFAGLQSLFANLPEVSPDLPANEVQEVSNGKSTNK